MTVQHTINIPQSERAILESLAARPDREAVESAWRHGRLYGRHEAMQAASRAVHDLPSVFGMPDVVGTPYPQTSTANADDGDAA